MGVLLGRLVHLNELQEYPVFFKLREPLELFFNVLYLKLSHVHIAQRIRGILRPKHGFAVLLSHHKLLNEVLLRLPLRGILRGWVISKA